MKLDPNLPFSAIKATEAAAIAAYRLMGAGDEKLADQVAVDAMRAELNKLGIDGTVVIGEGERDEAPMLYIGEKVGSGKGDRVDIALDPLEGTTILATGRNNALSVLALTNQGGFLNAPDVYMDKIAIGFDFPERLIDLDNTIVANLKNIALAKKCDVSDLLITILDRPRHFELIAKVREAGSKVALIQDGDVSAVISTHNVCDAYMGIGGAPEGVLAAAALCTMGGQMVGRLLFKSEIEKARAAKMGVVDFNKQYFLSEMAAGDVIFVATGVTNGDLLKGVTMKNNHITTHSIAMRSSTKTIYRLKTKHLKI